jgi:hypothetical protein
MFRYSVTAAIAALLILPSTAMAQADDLATLRSEIERLKQQIATPAKAGKASFNPDISLILSGTLSDFRQDPASYTLPGISLGEETDPGPEGFSLAESELVISANVDDYYFGRFTAALSPENSLEIEEAFIQTLALPAGLTLQAGRFFSEIGYLNSKHAHQWDFVDQPLVYRALLANQYRDDGLQLRWLAPTDRFLELGIEALRGDNYPAGGAANHGKGTITAFLTSGGDIGSSHSWQAGLSYLKARAEGRSTESGSLSFTGETELYGFDLVWKWAPQGNAYDQNLILQTELFQATETGRYNPGGAIDVTRRGGYVQAVYQFTHGWRTGLRVDRLRFDDPGSSFTGTVLDPAGHTPRRTSLMLDYARSEFSRLRLQFNRDESGPRTDNQWYLQYMMSLGAHGAHRF